jgi:aspartate-semialdehyde dehydrogenase
MRKLGIVGQRGMVGSVLMQRMREEGDFKLVQTTFFSTSQQGQIAPEVPNGEKLLADANDWKTLSKMDMIITCQGGDYTKQIHPILRKNGWQGYWIDAASSLRMEETAIIILDPLNDHHIRAGIKKGIKDYVGGNCTVSLMLLAIHGLLKIDAVEWVSSMTYQAASGAGAKNMRELIKQMQFLGQNKGELLENDNKALELELATRQDFVNSKFPKENFGQPLAANLLPWIDSELPNGQSREEWKACAEANKILGFKAGQLPIDGTCVRVGAMRSHSQGLTIKLKKKLSLQEIEEHLRGANQWVKLIPNNKEASISRLTPAAVTGTLDIAIGRVRKMNLGDDYINAFTVGDQLLWGAAEPLRRMLRILL